MSTNELEPGHSAAGPEADMMMELTGAKDAICSIQITPTQSFGTSFLFRSRSGCRGIMSSYHVISIGSEVGLEQFDNYEFHFDNVPKVTKSET